MLLSAKQNSKSFVASAAFALSCALSVNQLKVANF